MEIRTDRVGVLVDQLVDSKHLSSDRLKGLTAAEYFWEPYEGMWSIRRRTEATTPNAFGPDPHIPFIGIIRWTNRELIHHLAEVALLRDLYSASH